MTSDVLDYDALEPTCYGLTWAKNDDGSWMLPERTLGWQIAGWCSKYLRNPNGDGPWVFTDEQLRFILWWYAVDEYGFFIYRTGVLQRLKGWGKDPLLAVVCLVELAGPSRFSHWNEDGEPVGKAHPSAWVQVTAVSKVQTKNTMTLFPALMSKLFIDTYKIKAGAELIRGLGGKIRLEALTSNFRSLEGGRSTFIVLNETHHWIKGNGGHDMFDTIDGNATKMSGRYLAITNAYLPGEDSVAERMRESYEKIVEGRAVDVGFYYDTIEAHPQTPITPEALAVVIPKIRGDAVWLRIESILASIQSTHIAPARSRRMWLNQIVADQDALYAPGQLSAIEWPDEYLRPGDQIVLGFDGGKTDDDTALVAIRVSDGCAFVLCHEYKPDGPESQGWEVDRARVDGAVHEAFRMYNVLGFYADVALWESYIADWAERYGQSLQVKPEGRNPIAWDMRQSGKRIVMAHERLMTAIYDAKTFYNGDPSLRRHALNARRRTNNAWGISFGKESRESPRKVDLYAAWMLAHECLYDYRTRAKKPVRSGRGFFL